MTRPPVRQERGFALLVIFLIAAAVAFTMYQELPRVAFESARNKEQLLMDRGNQYKRAIQVFYAVNKRYPAEIKDLENTGEKRFLRRRYIDPMTGKDEWRLVHTNGSFLTDSLVTKPPAQNASNGLPGAGQTPGGGPLGANNLNTAPAAPATTTANPADAASAVPAPLNAAAQRRPSDRGFPTGPGFPQPPGAFNPGNGANPFGANPANFNPDDPSTWPPITLAPPSAQPGQGQPQPGITQRTGLPAGFQPQQPQPQNGLGQLAGQGGANPQPSALGNANTLGQNGLVALVPDPSAVPNIQNSGVPNQNQLPPNSDTQTPPFGNQPVAGPQPQPQPLFGGTPPFNASQFGNLAGAGFNPQNPNPPQPAAGTGQPNPLPGGPSGNRALDDIGNSLFRPNQAPTTGPTGSPGIAGVASKFEGPSIKAYKERTKYQEWEFIYEPAVNQPGAANQPGANQPGANPLGQPGTPAQNPLGPNPAAQTPGQPSAPASVNPFAPTNIFGPQAPTQ